MQRNAYMNEVTDPAYSVHMYLYIYLLRHLIALSRYLNAHKMCAKFLFTFVNYTMWHKRKVRVHFL